MKRRRNEFGSWERFCATGIVLCLVLILLSACGGGDWEEDDATKSTTPPDCKAQPELCR